MMTATSDVKIVKAWEFKSETSSRVYQTLKYENGEVTCNFPGWTRRTQPDGSRSCRHTRTVDFGTADAQCSGVNDYGEEKKVEMIRRETGGRVGRKLNL